MIGSTFCTFTRDFEVRENLDLVREARPFLVDVNNQTVGSLYCVVMRSLPDGWASGLGGDFKSLHFVHPPVPEAVCALIRKYR
jgi:hypothetical protein